MIFVTVGTQLPFDRMIEAVDLWAARNPATDVFAQIGPGTYQPRHVPFADFVPPAECRRRMQDADLVVAHAGMGTILTALELGKPVLVMPRHAALGEHRNDHQIATAGRFGDLNGVTVAADADALQAHLDALEQVATAERISPYASRLLLGALTEFING